MPNRRDEILVELFSIVQTLDLKFTPPGALSAVSDGRAVRRNKYRIIDTLEHFQRCVSIAAISKTPVKTVIEGLDDFITNTFPSYNTLIIGGAPYKQSYTDSLQRIVDTRPDKKSWLDKFKCCGSNGADIYEDILEATSEVLKDQRSRFDDRQRPALQGYPSESTSNTVHVSNVTFTEIARSSARQKQR